LGVAAADVASAEASAVTVVENAPAPTRSTVIDVSAALATAAQ
jgi:hypothetical protein